MDLLEEPITAKSRFAQGIIYLLEEWRALTVVFERTFVSNMAATVPWIAPLIPASFALKSASEKLHVQSGVEYIIAASIEGLGMSVTSTAFELWDWRDKNKDAQLSTQIRISIGTVVFYVVVVISVNIGLDLGWADWIVKAMLSLLSIPAVVTLALRSQHGRRVAEQQAAKFESEQKENASQEEQKRLNDIATETERKQNEIAFEIQRKQIEFDLEQKRLDAETRRQIKIEKSKTSITSESDFGTSKTSKTGSETSGTQKTTFKTGRKSTHRERVFQWMDEYFKTNGNVPTFSEVEQGLSLPQSTASRLRGEWLKERSSK